MKIAVCTISTYSHIVKSEVALHSVKKYNDVDLFCLVVDRVDDIEIEGVDIHYLNDLSDARSKKLITKYRGDALRWSLKSRYVAMLLQEGYDQVYYIDNDIFFYHSLQYAIEELKDAKFILTPHFYPTSTEEDQNWLEANFRVGLYNAGFFGATKEAISILDFWANCCLYNVKKSYWRGLFDDQKYLDLLPIMFDEVKVFKHPGYNFAGWNCFGHQLAIDDNRSYRISGKELVFVHFAPLTIEKFSDKENVFYPLFDDYLKALKRCKPGFNFHPKTINRTTLSAYFYYIRWKIARLRD